VIGLIVHGLAPQLGPGLVRFVRETPTMMEGVYSGDIAIDIEHRNGWDESQALRAKAFLQQRRESIRGLVESTQQILSVVFGGIVLIPILGLFLLSDGEKLANGIIQLVSTKETSAETRALVADLNDMLQRYSSQGHPGRSVTRLLLSCHAVAEIPARARSGAPGRCARVYSRGRLDHRASHDHDCWHRDALSLDLDGRTARSLADGHGLRNCHLHRHGWRGGRRNRRNLSLCTAGRRLACHLAQALLVTIGEGKQNSKGHEPHPHCESMGAAGMQRVLVCGLPVEETRLGHRDGGSDLRCCFFF